LQYAELKAQLFLVRGLNSDLAASKKELFQAGMPEGFDHVVNVA
jgi:hypothetical protein